MYRILIILPAWLSLSTLALSASFQYMTDSERIQQAGAIFRGTAIHSHAFQNPSTELIYTETAFRVDETLKGILPDVVRLVHRGGRANNRGEVHSQVPRFEYNTPYVICASRAGDGTLCAADGHAGVFKISKDRKSTSRKATPSRTEHFLASVRNEKRGGAPLPGEDFTDQRGTNTLAINGFLLNSITNANRWIVTDRGDPIPCIVDMEALPSGISSNQALGAVSNAFAAWSQSAAISFEIVGLEILGQAADTLPSSRDGFIYIQLHDLYGTITNGTTLGVGGGSFEFNTNFFPGGGTGGRVGTNEFDEMVQGFVVIKHTNASMQVLSTFEEGLTHELGHAIDMAHSSINPAEPDPLLSEAIMYFQLHQDGRGAMLGTNDINVVNLSYNTNNTPPSTHRRIIDAITASPQPSIPFINEVVINAYDLQGDSVSIVTTNAREVNGTWSLSGQTLSYTPVGFFSGPRIDPTTNSQYDRIHIRLDDGTNMSAPAIVRVLSFSPDSSPAGSDGLPDSWMTNFFGHVAPMAGDLSRATDDADGDGWNNLEELRFGTNPTNADSFFGLSSYDGTSVVWQGKAFEPYEIRGSTNIENGFSSVLLSTPVISTSDPARVSLTASNFSSGFITVNRIP